MRVQLFNPLEEDEKTSLIYIFIFHSIHTGKKIIQLNTQKRNEKQKKINNKSV